MGRKKAFDRDLALRTVMDEIWKNGYEACSVKAISEKLGITRSSFYHTFRSRVELFFEVLDLYVAESPHIALADIDGSRQVLRDICHIFKEICRERAKDPENRGCLAVNSVVELVGVDEKVGPRLENAIYLNIELFENALKIAAKRGEIANENIHIKALALQNLLIGVNVLAKVIHDFDELWIPTKYTLSGLDFYKEEFDEIV